MKNNFIKATVLFLFIGINIFAQTTQEKDIAKINELAIKMFEYTNDRNFDELLEMSHPKLFELVTKDQMKMVLKSTFEGNEEFSIDIPKMKPVYKLSEIFEAEKDSIKYAFISYDMNMSMTFNNQEFDDQAKKMMTLAMQSKGMDVNFTSSNSLDMFLKDVITIALKDKETENKWVIINYDVDSPITYEILKTPVLESVKVYKENLMLESKKKSEE